jgi:excisionase family DNA binding protein
MHPDNKICMKKDIFNLKFFTPVEISEIFRVPIRMIHALARQRKIPGITIGKLWRFQKEDI